MSAQRKRLIFISVLTVLLISAGNAVFASGARISRTVTPMEDGKFLIRVKVTSTGESIYGLRLVDPSSSIIDVYAPKQWCIVTDGGDLLARTGTGPVSGGKSVEFIIHSDTDETPYTWVVYGRMKQIGKPATM